MVRKVLQLFPKGRKTFNSLNLFFKCILQFRSLRIKLLSPALLGAAGEPCSGYLSHLRIVISHAKWEQYCNQALFHEKIALLWAQLCPPCSRRPLALPYEQGWRYRCVWGPCQPWWGRMHTVLTKHHHLWLNYQHTIYDHTEFSATHSTEIKPMKENCSLSQWP